MQHERVISATAGVYDGLQRSAAVSSNGFSGTQEQTYCWFGSSVTLKDEGDKRAEDSYYVGGAHVADLPDATEIGRGALERTLNRLGAGEGPDAKDGDAGRFTRGGVIARPIAESSYRASTFSRASRSGPN